MYLHIVLWIIGVTGAIASILAWRVEALVRSRAFRWGGCALLGALLLLMRSRMKIPVVRADLLPILSACIWWLPFVAWVFFMSLGRRHTPRLVDRARTSASFRGAEAAERRKDYQEAILLYHQAATEYPEDPQPRRCMAELFLNLGLPDDAIVSFKDAQKLEREPADKLLLAFAIAETLMDIKKDAPAAIQAIEDILARHPDVAGRPFAEARVQKMRALLKENPTRACPERSRREGSITA